MRRILCLVKAFILLFAIVGCVPVTPHLEKSIGKDELHGNKGLLIGTYTRKLEEPYYHIYQLYFRGVSNEFKSSILTRPSSNLSIVFKDDFKETDVAGNLFSYVLPAGKYEFYNYRVLRATGAGSTDWEAEKDFSMPFEIEAGEVTYIGEVQWFPLTEENFVGVVRPAGAEFRIYNEFGRDIQMFKRKYPEINWEKIEINNPTFEKLDPNTVKVTRWW